MKSRSERTDDVHTAEGNRRERFQVGSAGERRENVNGDVLYGTVVDPSTTLKHHNDVECLMRAGEWR